MQMFLAFLASSIPLGVPLLYGSVGEIITEKSGHLNLGIPGIMYVGSISGVIGAFFYEAFSIFRAIVISIFIICSFRIGALNRSVVCYLCIFTAASG